VFQSCVVVRCQTIHPIYNNNNDNNNNNNIININNNIRIYRNNNNNNNHLERASLALLAPTVRVNDLRERRLPLPVRRSLSTCNIACFRFVSLVFVCLLLLLLLLFVVVCLLYSVASVFREVTSSSGCNESFVILTAERIDSPDT
jgi:hypothetical protein